MITLNKAIKSWHVPRYKAQGNHTVCVWGLINSHFVNQCFYEHSSVIMSHVNLFMIHRWPITSQILCQYAFILLPHLSISLFFELLFVEHTRLSSVYCQKRPWVYCQFLQSCEVFEPFTMTCEQQGIYLCTGWLSSFVTIVADSVVGLTNSALTWQRLCAATAHFDAQTICRNLQTLLTDNICSLGLRYILSYIMSHTSTAPASYQNVNRAGKKMGWVWRSCANNLDITNPHHLGGEKRTLFSLIFRKIFWRIKNILNVLRSSTTFQLVVKF